MGKNLTYMSQLEGLDVRLYQARFCVAFPAHLSWEIEIFGVQVCVSRLSCLRLGVGKLKEAPSPMLMETPLNAA